MFKLTVICVVALASAVNYYDRPEHVRKRMLGSRLDRKSSYQGYEVKKHTPEEAEAFLASAPAKFDARVQWPQCKNVIGFIKDQAACGSCWAVAATETLADRFCISCGYGALPYPANEANITGVKANEGFMPDFSLSSEELMTCCDSCGDGCDGGYPIDAMKRCQTTGLISGGWYGSECGCQSYKIDPTDEDAYTPDCFATCDDPTFPTSQTVDRHFCTSAYSVVGASAMMEEIMTNGPIECGFTVTNSFENFFRVPSNAKSVYKRNGWFDQELGGHAIKIIGWDTAKDGTPFWLINNSWNVTWGDNGQFRYLRGKDLDGMESECVAAKPKCDASKNQKWTRLQCKGRDF